MALVILSRGAKRRLMTSAGDKITRPRARRPALARAVPAILSTVVLAACERSPAAPTFSFFGSYFPAWIICTGFGVVAAVVMRKIFIVAGLDEALPVKLLVYASLALIAAVGLWFLWFGGGPR